MRRVAVDAFPFRSSRGHALIDRALYLPEAWAKDSSRRAEAKGPESKAFATKPMLARALIKRAVTAGVPCRWVAADDVFGGDARFRECCEKAGLYYVVAASKARTLWMPDGVAQRLENIAARWTARQWRERSCGFGSKGERRYRWAYQAFGSPRINGSGAPVQFGLLVRESLTPSSNGVHERAYYLTLAPGETVLEKLVAIAGCRWSIEECFEQAKQETGLADYEMRSWAGRHRHVTLSMLAHAALAVTRARANAEPPSPKKKTVRWPI